MNTKWVLDPEHMVVQAFFEGQHYASMPLPLSALMERVKSARAWRQQIMNTGYDKNREDQIMENLKGHRIRA